MEMEAERKGRKTKDFDTVYQCRACQHSSEDGALHTFRRVPLTLPANTFLAQGQLEGYGHDEAILFRCKACPDFVVVGNPVLHWEDVHQRGRCGVVFTFQSWDEDSPDRGRFEDTTKDFPARVFVMYQRIETPAPESESTPEPESKGSRSPRRRKGFVWKSC